MAEGNRNFIDQVYVINGESSDNGQIIDIGAKAENVYFNDDITLPNKLAEIANNSALTSKSQINITTDKVTSIVLNDSSDCNIVNLICDKKDNNNQVAFYRKNLFDFSVCNINTNDLATVNSVDRDNCIINFTTNETGINSGIYFLHIDLNLVNKGYGIDYTKLNSKPVTLSFDAQSDIDCILRVQFTKTSYTSVNISSTKQRFYVTEVVDMSKLNKAICFYLDNVEATVTISNIQIEVNNTATDYEDCDYQKVTLTDANINSLHTYYPSTTVISDSDFILTYIADTKNYIDNNLDTKENISNKIDTINFPSTTYYPSSKAVWDYVTSKTSTLINDIENLKNNKVNIIDFNTFKDTTNQAIADNIKSIKANINTISRGEFYLSPTFTKGTVDKTTGEVKDGAAFITDKLDLSQYNAVTVTTDRPTLYTSVYEYDSNSNFKRIVADTKNKITFSPIIGYKYIIWLWYGGTDISKIAAATIVGKAINTIAENDTRYELAKETCKLDLPDAFYIQKGGTLELFKYGMYYSNYEFVENKYNVRLVNMSGYVTEYSDKIVITCPANYTDETLRKPNDLPLFQLLDRFGNVIDSKRVKIYVADISALANTTRRIMYLGDSFTGMAVRSGETANLISQTTLTDTKLIGRSIGQGSGNKFTGTGGYSWANYTENPNTLPSAYPNNYLWVDSYNGISMKHFVQNALNETQLDYLVILLGWNDYENGAFASKFNWSDLKMRAKKLIENTHIGFPNCKIILESYHYMYPYNCKSYGNTMPQVRQNKYIYDLNKLYQEIANEYDYVTFVQMSCQIDVLHNMTMESTKVNKRSEKTVEYCKDCVHPANEGFYQYSDAEFTTLTYLMTKETPTVEEGE